MKTEKIIIESKDFNIRGVVHFPARVPAPCVICSHGLFSAKESPKFLAMTQYLAQRGFVAIRYDHRGCGESSGNIEDTTVSGRLEDLAAVCGYAQSDSRMKRSIGLMGSSMGGYISLFAAARYPEVRATVVWATPFRLQTAPGHVNADGYPMLKPLFYADLKHYHLSDVLGNIQRTLVLHGEGDDLVPLRHASKIYECLGSPKELKIFTGGDHRFTDASIRKRAAEMTANWFESFLFEPKS